METMSGLRYGFLTKGKSRSVKPILVLRDNTNVYTATRWDRQEFIYTLRFGYWPSDMLIIDMDADQLYIVRGRIVYDRETPKNHVFMEVAR